jgi:hypothetical protein
MALDVKVISFNTGTGASGTTVTITPGFETKAGLTFWAGRTGSSDGNGAGTHDRGCGMFTSSTSFRSFGTRSTEAAGTADAFNQWNNTCCVNQVAATVGRLDVQSISSTQVVFEVVTAFTTDLRVTVICLGGSDITGTEIKDFNAAGTAPVDQEFVMNGSFDPTLVFVMGTRAGNEGVTRVDSLNCFGVAKSASECFAFGGGSNDGSNSMITESYLRLGDIYAAQSATFNAIDTRATFVSLSVASGKGCTIHWEARAQLSAISVLFLGGTFQSKIGSFTTQTDTTTDMTGTTTFTPKGLLFLSHNKAENSAGGLSAHDKWSIGLATSTSEQHCQAMADLDAIGTSVVSTALEQDHIYVNMNESTQALQGSANLTAISGTGFTARMTDADPSGASVCWLALGDAAAAGGSASGAFSLAPVTLSATATRIVNVSGALALAPEVLAGSVAVSRSASGALIVPPANLAASAAVTRTATGGLTTAPVTLAATAGVLILAEGALSVPATVLASNVTVARSASVALNVAPLTLAASLAVDRTVVGTLTITGPVLAASAAITRSASGAVIVPAPTLAADVLRIVSSAGAMALAPTALSASSSVARSASGALDVPGPMLDASVLGAGLSTSGTLAVSPVTVDADATIDRSTSAAITVPAMALSADVMRTVSSTGALAVAPVVLSAAVSVIRFANGALALAVPVLSADVAGEQLSVTGALLVPPVVLDADVLITRSASGTLALAAPVLAATADRTVNVQGVLILEAPSLSAQAAIARFVSVDLELPGLLLAASSFAGAIQSVIGLRASVTAGGQLEATVTAVQKSSTIH